jgi:hypothetical protein
VAWVSALMALCPEIIALDGKAIRRFLDRTDGKGPIHVINTWASRKALVPAQFKVAIKNNEITAGYPGEIVRQIIDQKSEFGYGHGRRYQQHAE